MRCSWLISAVVAIAAVTGARAGDLPPTPAPERLSETRLYLDPITKTVDPRNRPFAPQYPLWTDGASKSRWIYLPEGTTIDVSDVDAWSFPVGTKLWKEFSFAERRVETRMLWHAREGEWVFASYAWNEAQTEATLAPEGGLRRAYEIEPGRWHAIPSRTDCTACHEGGPSTVLGFSALQLSTDRDPLAPHADRLRPEMVTLRTLVDERRLVPERRELLNDPPRIPARTPRERAALGYLSANCGACHNARGPLATLGLVLAHRSTGSTIAIDAPSGYAIPGLPEGATRIVAPGSPERSALLYRMASRRPSSQMPPLGTATVDAEAVELIRGWIADDLAAQPERP
jgi:hypothetical protein